MWLKAPCCIVCKLKLVCTDLLAPLGGGQPFSRDVHALVGLYKYEGDLPCSRPTREIDIATQPNISGLRKEELPKLIGSRMTPGTWTAMNACFQIYMTYQWEFLSISV